MNRNCDKVKPKVASQPRRLEICFNVYMVWKATLPQSGEKWRDWLRNVVIESLIVVFSRACLDENIWMYVSNYIFGVTSYSGIYRKIFF